MTVHESAFLTLDYCRARLEVYSPHEAVEHVSFIERVLGLKPGARVLDVGCGAGRHTVELAARGYMATGLDIGEEALAVARRRARERGVSPTFTRGDILGAPFSGEFDAVVSVAGFLGVFESVDENCRILKNIRKALKTGGRFFIHVLNRDFVVAQHLAPLGKSVQQWQAWQERYVLEEWRFDMLTSQVHIRLVLLDGSAPREIEYPLRVYACHELRAMLEDAGFGVDAAFGGFDGQAVRASMRGLIITAHAV